MPTHTALSSGSSVDGGSTVIGDPFAPQLYGIDELDAGDKGKQRAGAPARKLTSFLDDPPSLVQLQREGTEFFHQIDDANGGLLGALKRLDEELVASGRQHLISHKRGRRLFGRPIEPGQAGFYTHGAQPRIIIEPARYPGFWLANWIARSWAKEDPVRFLSSSVLAFNGFFTVNARTNQAIVVASPSNDAFVVTNGGFVALALNGHYRVLGVVDQVNLKHTMQDPHAQNRVLGRCEYVLNTPAGGSPYVVATFLDIPASNVVIIQKGDDLEELSAGQHCILNASITIRGFYSKAESQLELKSPDIYTRDQVPVALKVYVRWVLLDPLKLCRAGYEDAYSALKDKTLSCLTQVVSHLDYTALIKQRGFDSGEMVENGDNSAAFLDALRNNAMDDLRAMAAAYGIELRDLAVIDRQFKGETARTLDSLTVRALQAQVEAANIDRENSNKVKAQEGALEVAAVAAKQRQTEADAHAYTTIKAAQASAEAVEIAARARAKAVRLEADADAAVLDEQARRMQLARLDVQRVKAYGDRTVFVAESVLGATVAAGHALTVGQQLAVQK
ncbi:hypothetical protein JCM8097_000441 [Rhodosporidiobolus ruineniae]